MADASSGVSGASSRDSASSASSAQHSQAANEVAESQLAEAISALGGVPTPSLVEAAPVDLSIAVSALSQLNAMAVDAPALDFSSLNALGGVVSTPANYAQVAQSLPAAPAVEEFNVFSPSFAITGFDPADIANADINAIGLELGLSYDGNLTGALSATYAPAPGTVTVQGHIGIADAFDSARFGFTAGPFGNGATPSLGLNAAAHLDLGTVNAFDLSAAINFDPNGLRDANVNATLTHEIDDALDAYTQGSLNFDRDGLQNLSGGTGLRFDQGGVSWSLGGFGRVDARTGDATGGVRFDARIRF